MTSHAFSLFLSLAPLETYLLNKLVACSMLILPIESLIAINHKRLGKYNKHEAQFSVSK